MDFQRLRTFRTVATLMNFNQAAQVLNYAQSSISAQIKTLEDEIGAELFKRTGKKVTLTEAGEKMLTYAHKLLAIEEEARAEIAGKPKVPCLLTLRVPQTVATYHLPAVLSDFRRRFPKPASIFRVALFTLWNTSCPLEPSILPFYWRSR